MIVNQFFFKIEPGCAFTRNMIDNIANFVVTLCFTEGSSFLYINFYDLEGVLLQRRPGKEKVIEQCRS